VQGDFDHGHGSRLEVNTGRSRIDSRSQGYRVEWLENVAGSKSDPNEVTTGSKSY